MRYCIPMLLAGSLYCNELLSKAEAYIRRGEQERIIGLRMYKARLGDTYAAFLIEDKKKKAIATCEIRQESVICYVDGGAYGELDGKADAVLEPEDHFSLAVRVALAYKERRKNPTLPVGERHAQILQTILSASSATR
jgi:hypothetical protein